MTQMAERLDQQRHHIAPRPVDAAPRTSAPVNWWAAVGAAYLVFNNNQDPNGGSVHLDPNGNLVVPANTALPSVVPFDRGK